MSKVPSIHKLSSAGRGFADHGWLKSHHTFSFADYYNPEYMGFRTLRVINEDFVAPGMGFGAHPHRDMEIITIVLDGALEHKDSMGNTSVIKPQEVQRMSAGTGVTHSEFNHSKNSGVHLYQVWILPQKKGITPEYEQKSFEAKDKENRLRLIVSPDGNDGSLRLNQDAYIYDGTVDAGKTISYAVKPNRGVWVQVQNGQISINGVTFDAGDAAAIEQAERIDIAGTKRAAIILFDLI